MKTFLTFLLIIALSNSLPAWSDINDVYYCTTKTFIEMDREGKTTQFAPESFKFKVTEEEIQFGESFIDTSLPYKVTHMISSESKGLAEYYLDFRAETPFSRVLFDEGAMFWSTQAPYKMRSFVASCDIFK